MGWLNAALFDDLSQYIPGSKPVDSQALDKIQEAYAIAVKTLRSQYTEYGVQAGKTHFSDVWTRDCCFASLGCLAIADTAQVRTSLEAFLSYMTDDGQIPLRIGEKAFLLKYLGLARAPKGRPGAVYIEDKHVSVTTDCNSLFVMLVAAYYRKTRDKLFLRAHYRAIRRALEWNLLQSGQDLLMEEGPFAGWADSVRKRGKVLYTNVLHYQAVSEMGLISRWAGEKYDGEAYSILAKKIKHAINETFWNGYFYVDWIGVKTQHYFSTDGNAFAIVFGIADKRRSKKIQAYIQTHKMDDAFCIDSSHPRYRFEHVYKPFYLIQLEDYHNGLKWLWIGCIDAIAKAKSGLERLALKQMLKIAHKIVEFDGVYEVYEPTGKPVKRMFYKSEQDFAWASGLFIWACHELDLLRTK